MPNKQTDPEYARLLEGLRNAEFDEILGIVAAAIRLESALYGQEEFGPYLFRLRKALEGVWGNLLPRVDEWGEDDDKTSTK